MCGCRCMCGCGCGCGGCKDLELVPESVPSSECRRRPAHAHALGRLALHRVPPRPLPRRSDRRNAYWFGIRIRGRDRDGDRAHPRDSESLPPHGRLPGAPATQRPRRDRRGDRRGNRHCHFHRRWYPSGAVPCGDSCSRQRRARCIPTAAAAAPPARPRSAGPLATRRPPPGPVPRPGSLPPPPAWCGSGPPARPGPACREWPPLAPSAAAAARSTSPCRWCSRRSRGWFRGESATSSRSRSRS
mmetsp:Transcript_6621/g.19022  ORF Transcript_6621/g.19022 Transcript_6621/m.19022 type:complete len:244 (+) Transcript_6621:4060-4791(+)